MTRLNSFYDKEIISIISGARLGEISDIEIEETTGKISALILNGRLRLFGLLGRKESMYIPWENVRVIGEETVLVYTESDIIDDNIKTHKTGIIKSFLS